MAQFLNQAKESPMTEFDAMGKPIPFLARQAGYEACIAMGCDKPSAYECVSAVAEALARDEPYTAMEAGMRYLDLTGTYRLMATLLANAVKAPQ